MVVRSFIRKLGQNQENSSVSGKRMYLIE